MRQTDRGSALVSNFLVRARGMVGPVKIFLDHHAKFGFCVTYRIGVGSGPKIWVRFGPHIFGWGLADP